ncbi:hypothetical protein GGS24DRAFT_489096 [Hypoxylon argillaceum]|nr:hypothetical protein GGS24DRAFT_489096 [Hypoxylon argillaceum]
MYGNNPFARLNRTQIREKSRLAVLAPSDDQNAPIKLTLIDADLINTSYECISYERAKDAKNVTVSVNDEDYEIPEALESALRTFRHLLVSRTAEERSGEATMIREIPQNADRTLCWLGLGTKLTSKAQGCLDVNLSQDGGLIRVTPKQIDGIRASSVQCIPEIVLAKVSVIVCGRSNILWPNYGRYFPGLPSIEIAERRHRLGESIELSPMIKTARECEAQDPRDYIFSMIPISTPSMCLRYHNAGPQPLPAVDYSKSTQEVFTDAARYTVLERQDLLMWEGERPPCAKRIKGLPTWVPDFSIGDPATYRFNLLSDLRQWSDTVQPRKTIRVTSDNALQVQAYPLDRVEHVSRPFNAGNCTRVLYDEFLKLPGPVGETLEQRNERFWRTLLTNAGPLGDTFLGTAPPPPSVGDSFRSIIAQETVLALLGCTPSELTTPEVSERMAASPEVMELMELCGYDEQFGGLLFESALGRRFFRTSGGRFGMTAVEDVVSADPTLEAAETEAQGQGDKSDLAYLSRVGADPTAVSLLKGFQGYLAEKDPKLASILAQAHQQQEDRLSKRRGVAKGDIVVALIGGCLPYILRPKLNTAGDGAGEGSSQIITSGSTYEFVGGCYLHGSMDGEDFKVKSWFGKTRYHTDLSKIVDISIL